MSAKNKSTYLFPGDTVYFYPVIKILKAHKMHTCALSGALIYPGSEYIFNIRLFCIIKQNINLI